MKGTIYFSFHYYQLNFNIIYIYCKIGGFSSHSSKRGCYRCDHTFYTIQDSYTGHWKPDFSNFTKNLSQYSKTKHQTIAYKYKEANATMRNKIFTEHGIRWTPLLRLPYMDV